MKAPEHQIYMLTRPALAGRVGCAVRLSSHNGEDTCGSRTDSGPARTIGFVIGWGARNRRVSVGEVPTHTARAEPSTPGPNVPPARRRLEPTWRQMLWDKCSASRAARGRLSSHVQRSGLTRFFCLGLRAANPVHDRPAPSGRHRRSPSPPCSIYGHLTLSPATFGKTIEPTRADDSSRGSERAARVLAYLLSSAIIIMQKQLLIVNARCCLFGGRASVVGVSVSVCMCINGCGCVFMCGRAGERANDVCHLNREIS
jgi:hypothetical protein